MLRMFMQKCLTSQDLEFLGIKMKLKNGHLWKFALMGTHCMCLLHLCSSTWIPKGDYIASNTDECTSTLSYAVSLKKPGSVSFQYFYPDNRMFFEFYVSTVSIFLFIFPKYIHVQN